MIDVFKETTNWDVANHIYFIDKKTHKMVAYIQQNTETLVRFKTPLSFDKRRRTFNKIATYKSLDELS